MALIRDPYTNIFQRALGANPVHVGIWYILLMPISIYLYGWLSKLWSCLGFRLYYGTSHLGYLKGDHNLDNHTYTVYLPQARSLKPFILKPKNPKSCTQHSPLGNTAYLHGPLGQRKHVTFEILRARLLFFA